MFLDIVGLSNICYTVFNKFIQDSLRRLPTQRSHREPVIVSLVINLKLLRKVLE